MVTRLAIEMFVDNESRIIPINGANQDDVLCSRSSLYVRPNVPYSSYIDMTPETPFPIG